MRISVRTFIHFNLQFYRLRIYHIRWRLKIDMVLRYFPKQKRILIFVIFILSCSTLLIGCNINTKYDIERVFTDDTFKNIIEGKTKPVEIIVGFGGENGYEVFSTRDPAVIDKYINAFRDVRIEAEIKDKDKMMQRAK